ncbi:hypothetical protein J8273_0813 [Carpediemonas membranifera]|uniref:Uncharacterized protein n=1 Tax=Carpediemonas membranifera TaxID=201153 RepID=A0A8J6B8A1_9EUKA|nr:hypothetical protein J8273_0813 [Carpediemonas membranifera]|eukprot:KAG9397683.1 hypothetical protein J8273_0813 [Carpediemonas membranifera]
MGCGVSKGTECIVDDGRDLLADPDQPCIFPLIDCVPASPYTEDPSPIDDIDSENSAIQTNKGVVMSSYAAVSSSSPSPSLDNDETRPITAQSSLEPETELEIHLPTLNSVSDRVLSTLCFLYDQDSCVWWLSRRILSLRRYQDVTTHEGRCSVARTAVIGGRLAVSVNDSPWAMGSTPTVRHVLSSEGSVFIIAGNSVFAFGANHQGVLGVGSVNSTLFSPVRCDVTISASTQVCIYRPDNAACYLELQDSNSSDYQLFVAGSNIHGRFGVDLTESTIYRFTSVPLVPPMRYLDLTVTPDRTIGFSGQTVVVSGNNGRGQLAVGSRSDVHTLTRLIARVDAVRFAEYSLLLLSGGKVLFAGWSLYHPLGKFLLGDRVMEQSLDIDVLLHSDAVIPDYCLEPTAVDFPFPVSDLDITESELYLFESADTGTWYAVSPDAVSSVPSLEIARGWLAVDQRAAAEIWIRSNGRWHQIR